MALHDHTPPAASAALFDVVVRVRARAVAMAADDFAGDLELRGERGFVSSLCREAFPWRWRVGTAIAIRRSCHPALSAVEPRRDTGTHLDRAPSVHVGKRHLEICNHARPTLHLLAT